MPNAEFIDSSSLDRSLLTFYNKWVYKFIISFYILCELEWTAGICVKNESNCRFAYIDFNNGDNLSHANMIYYLILKNKDSNNCVWLIIHQNINA